MVVEVVSEVAAAEDLEVAAVEEDLEAAAVEVDEEEASEEEEVQVEEDVDSEAGDDLTVTVWCDALFPVSCYTSEKAAFSASAWPVGLRIWTLPFSSEELEWIFSFLFYFCTSYEYVIFFLFKRFISMLVCNKMRTFQPVRECHGGPLKRGLSLSCADCIGHDRYLTKISRDTFTNNAIY